MVQNRFFLQTRRGHEQDARTSKGYQWQRNDGHNTQQSKLEEPRMPVILPTELEDKWLHNITDELDIKAIKELIREYPEDELQGHTVAKLRGKEYAGNVESISDEVVYGDLVF